MMNVYSAGKKCVIGLLIMMITVASVGTAEAAPLSVEDFTFEGPLGSQGTSIKKLGENHFEVTLGHAPGHEDWNNKLQFTILQNAKGNELTLDVVFEKGKARRYTFNEYAGSYSYNTEDWMPLQWDSKGKETFIRDTMRFPKFTEDKVYVGHQVPMSYEKMVQLIKHWKDDPRVTVHTLGKSIEGRNLYRIELNDPKSLNKAAQRWVHYFANQHPGEHNSQWRIVGMIDWLLSDAGRDALQRSTAHFIIMMSPDAPSHGWYRVNAQGHDMNRTYLRDGANKDKQAHEAYVFQKDLEGLMASSAPLSTHWSIHTWGGRVDPRIIPGPELGKALGAWEDFAKRLAENDTEKLFKAMELWPFKESNANQWAEGVHFQFGITSILCEGAGTLYTKQENIESGAVLMRTITEHYDGLRR